MTDSLETREVVVDEFRIQHHNEPDGAGNVPCVNKYFEGKKSKAAVDCLFSEGPSHSALKDQRRN